MSTSGLNPGSQVSSPFTWRLMYLPLAVLTAIALLLVTMPGLLRELLSSAYLPHAYCYLSSKGLVWTHVVSDVLIALAYLAISGTLAYLIYRGRNDLRFHGLFFAFGAFIIACASSHFVEAVTVWLPVYVLSAAIKVVTAIASLITAAMLPLAVPQIISLAQRARTSEERRVLLEQTLVERDAAQVLLEESNTLLEHKVKERTAQISRAKEELEAEVAERQRSWEQLRQSEEKFIKTFRSSPLPMTLSTQADARYLDVNDAFLDLVGRDRGLVVGRTAEELKFWADPQDRTAMVKRLNEEGRVRGLAARMTTGGGVVREVVIWAEQIEIHGESCVLAITQDTTETKRLEAQFQQAQKMEAVGRLAGGVAHDFNNILGIITGYSELSQEKIDQHTPVAQNLEQIKLAANRAANLTRQLLAFSRQQVVSLRVLDLNAVVNDVMTMLTRVVGEDISLEFQPSLALWSIKVDRGQIEQVLLNLVVNARDAIPDIGTITIATSNVELDDNFVLEHGPTIPGEYVMLSVWDTGSGMDEATRARIFEPFFTTKEPGKGTGLGLASVYGIVKQSNGYIWAYSELGLGTTFKLYFPRVRADAEPINPVPASSAMTKGNETIVLVEDEPTLRSVTAATLRSVGYTVLEASTPDAAVHLAETHPGPIQLLLTDVVLPHMNGVELSKRLAALRPELKVIFISGYGGEELARHISSVPDAVLVEKPFSRQTLLMKIRAVLHA